MYGKLGRGGLSDSILCHYNYARGLRTQMGIILVLTRTLREANISFLPRKSSLNKGISNKEVAVKPKFAIQDVKNEVSFLYARTSFNKTCLHGSLFPGNLDPSSLTPASLAVLLVCVFRRQDNLTAWRELFAKLESRI